MTAVQFDVLGVPAAQGSKRHVGNGRMVESSKALHPWRDSVAAAARDAAKDHGCLDGNTTTHADLTGAVAALAGMAQPALFEEEDCGA